MSTGVVLPQVQIYKPIPAPALPAGRIPQVNLYLCYTLDMEVERRDDLCVEDMMLVVI